ncbi:tail fiber domain-containing protein [Microcoleus sp. POL10_C6]|uniref:tail fiber domain-containing protein n=1 Tax=Microcoleus sp. POL10_C6 TaxID=2818852 RepID=UPI002FD68EFE
MTIKELKNINQRPRYFAGQYLLEDDFELEQDYSRDRLQRYTRSLHVSGIADGLIVTKPNESSLKLIVDVSAGTAIDPQGRQVVLHESRQVNLSENLVETVTLNNGDYILYIGYDEQEAEPQDKNPSTNRRILENPIFKLIKFSTSPPSEDSIAIAKLTIKDGIVAISSDSSVRKYTGLRLPALENAPTLRSKGGNLAVFSGSLEIAGTQIVGSTTLENHLYLSGGTGPFAQFYRDAIDGKDYLGIEAFKQDDFTIKTGIVLQEFGGNVGIGGAPASGANGEKLKVAGNTTIAGTLSITGANNSLTVEGTSTLTNNVGIGGAPSTGTEKLKVTGNTTIAGNLSVTGTDKKLTVEGNLRLGTNAGGSKLLLTHADYTHYIQANNYWTEFVSHPNEGWRFIARNDEKDATSVERLTVTGSGKVAIAGTLSVTSTSTLTGKVGIGGDPSAGSEKLKVTGNTTIAGNLTVSGKYVVQNQQNGGNTQGIFMWSAEDSNWGIYMGESGASKSLSAGIAVAGKDFTNHAIRLRTYSAAGNGLIYENSNEQLNFSVRASDGRTYIRGNAGVGTDATEAQMLTVGGNTAIAGNLSVTGANNNLAVDGTSTLTGKVGIGGAPATGTEKLAVTGNAAIAGNLSVTGTDKKLTVEGNLRLGTNAGGSKLLLTHADYTHYIQANNYWTEFVSHPNEGWRFIARNDEKDATSVERLTVTGSGKVAIAGTLSVTSTSTLTGKVGIGGDPSAGSEKLKVTGNTTIAGNLTVSGKYVVQNQQNGGNTQGIFMWSAEDSNWGIYMGESGASKSLSAGIAVAGKDFTNHAIRLRTYSAAGNGLIYENSNEELNFSVRASDGRTYIRGNVGIGTTEAPSKAKLVVEGSGGNYSIPSHRSYTSDGPSERSPSPINISNVSIYASDRIVCSVISAFSDKRIKNIQGRSESASDLHTLLGIEITDFRYKDISGKGNALHKKVIGQQVEKVFPQSVSKHIDVVPDIYQLAPITDGWVALATDLKPGDRVKLIAEEGEEGIYEVMEVAEEKFRTAFKPKGEKVFVFGREVNDFRIVDYDAIAMLNVSATQELYKRLDRLQLEVEQLQASLYQVKPETLADQASNGQHTTAILSDLP